MPTYSYICDNCNKCFELFFTISKYNDSPWCEYCKSNAATHRDYQTDLGSMTGSIIKSDSELSTVGDLANRNRDRMSNDQKNHLYHKHNEYKETQSNNPLPQGMSRIKKPSYKTKWS